MLVYVFNYIIQELEADEVYFFDRSIGQVENCQFEIILDQILSLKLIGIQLRVCFNKCSVRRFRVGVIDEWYSVC